MAKPPGPILQNQLREAFAAFSAGRTERAEEIADSVLRLASKEPNALYLKGIIAHQDGKLKQAARYFEKSYKADSKNAAAVSGLGIVRLDQGRGAEAERLLQKALRLMPRQAPLYNNLGLALKLQGKVHEAMSAFQKAVSIDCRFVPAQTNLGELLRQLFGTKEAYEHFAQAMNIMPEEPEIVQNYAVYLGEAGAVERCVEILENLFAKHPKRAGLGKLLASMMLNLSRFADAEAILARLLDENPNDIEAMLDYSELLISRDPTRKEEANRLVDRAIDVYENTTEDENLTSIAPLMRLAKGYERQKDYRKAFDIFTKAQSDRRDQNRVYGKSYSRENMVKTVSGLIDVFSGNQFQETLGDPSTKPVFIVGLPRSGTTLLEQILSSHDQVACVGEFGALPSLLDPFLARHGDLAATIRHFGESDWAALAEGYLDELNHAAPKADHVVDKLPTNFLNVGIIRTIFPNATILHSQRDLVDTGWSIFTQFFSQELNFAHDLRDIGHYTTQYVRLMRFWHEWDPQSIPIRYEDVIEDARNAVTPALAAMGLEWQDSMYTFHKRTDAVITASRLQVRQPIYKSSKQKWRRYEAFLSPLLEALGPLGKDDIDPWQ